MRFGRFMNRSTTSLIMIAAMVGLLIALGVLQFVWLGQVSDGELARLRSRVEADSRRFADDFNREIQTAFFNFQLSAEAWRTAGRPEFIERYDFWRERSAYPTLIRSFTYADLESGKFERFDPVSRSFSVSELPPSLAPLRAFVTKKGDLPSLIDDGPVLLMPIYDVRSTVSRIVMRTGGPVGKDEPPAPQISAEMPERIGILIVELDSDTIRNSIFADLRQKYFAESDERYELAVFDRENRMIAETRPVTAPDATARLMDLSPDNFVFFGNRDLMPRTAGAKRSIVLSSTTRHVETRSVSSVPQPNANSNMDVQIITENISPAPQGVREMRITRNGGDAAWTLKVQHSSGSIEGYVASNRRRNVAVSFGILGLLGISFLFIFVSAQRARTFAQRQVDFVSSVSHEFRTPLAVIYSASENLADGVAREPEQITRYGELIKGEGRKLSAMVEQILEFAGARSGKRRYDLREVSVDDVVRSAIEECRPMIDEAGFEIETSIDGELPLINGDRAALSRAIQNLITNAIKYSNGFRCIRISASYAEGRVVIKVADEGLGIAAKDLKHIFEPFYRARNVVDEQIHGNGLGLSLVRETIEAHGGRVSAESEPGKGSVFSVELPVGGKRGEL